MRKSVWPAMALVGILILASGCTTTGRGAAIGAGAGTALGAASGAIIGHQSGHTGEGALIGGLVGAAAGTATGAAVGHANQRNREQDAAIAQAQQDANTQIVNVKNSNGSITPVRLVRQGATWVGPRGEVYTSLPTEEQLRSVYGF